MNHKNIESMDFTDDKPRIQKDGWNYGKQTIKKKTSITLDEDIGEHLERLKEQKGLFMGSIINQSLRNYFQLGF
jgi:hypothetical protein|tara:strand:- start:1308 stop:1529 length:222 start_codon:yes stop_codon:yes gene_type:complete